MKKKQILTAVFIILGTIKIGGMDAYADQEFNQEQQVITAYAPVLDAYKRVSEAGEASYTEEEYIGNITEADRIIREPLYYAFYDFCNDGTPELLIGKYFENRNSFGIADIYGSDGTNIQRMAEGMNGGAPTGYVIGENNILMRYWATGGFTAGGFGYYKMQKNGMTAVKMEDYSYNGNGDCIRNENEPISQELYKNMKNEYEERTDIQYDWKPIETWDINSEIQPVSETIEGGMDDAGIYYSAIVMDYKAAEQNQYMGNTNSYPYVKSSLLDGNAKELYFATVDICGDSIPELVIAEKLPSEEEQYNIVDIYGFANGYAQHLMVGVDLGITPLNSLMGTPCFCNVCENGVIKMEDINPPVITTTYYKLHENSTLLGKEITFISNDQGCIIGSGGGLVADIVSREEFSQKKNETESQYPLKQGIAWRLIANACYTVVKGSKDCIPIQQVYASSTSDPEPGYTYYAENLIDGDITTPWVEGKEGYGEGESVTLYFDTSDVKGLVIYPGYCGTRYQYDINAYPTSIWISYDNEVGLGYKLESNQDTLGPVYVYFPEVIHTNNLKITISQVGTTPQTKYEDTCISEIQLIR